MVFWQDPWFRGLDLTQSPDGSAVVIDWSDIGECHDDDGVHRTSGRIYKVAYDNPKQIPYKDLLTTLTGLYRADRNAKQPMITGKDVVSIISHPNVWFTQQLLKHYTLNGFTSPVQDPGPLVQMAINAPKDFRSSEARFDVTKQLRALWALKACKLLDNEKLLNLLKTKQHESVHSWAIRLLLDSAPNTGSLVTNKPVDREFQIEILDCLFANSRPHSHPHLRLTLASLLPKLPDVFEPLVTKLLKSEDLADDLTFSLVLWYGIKDQVVENPMQMAKWMQSTSLPKVQELVLRRLAAMVTEKHPDSQQASEALAFFLADAVQRDTPDIHAACIRALWGAYQGRSQVDKPAYWEQLASLASKHPDPAVVRLAVLVGSIVDRADDPEPLLRMIAMKDVPLAERKAAVEAIGKIDTPEAIERLERLMEDPDLANAAAFAMRSTLSKPRAAALVERYAQASQPARTGIISALASRIDSMEVLLDAIEKNTIPQDQVDATTWRQFQSAGNWELLERARKLNKSLELPGNRQEMIEKEESLLTTEAIQKGDVNSGRAIWITKCANCHKLYGEGGQIGPELTGAQRSNLRYWLENILAPSALVAENYRVTALRMQDGRVITGVVVSESPRELTVQTAQERVLIFSVEIDQRSASQMSLMPEGLLEGLGQEQKASLLKYLMSSPQELSK
jgi:putative heme-binding domain-containing protein